ncbi:MAG: hypothetical protein CMB61_06720 [Euryarchaeota archaeon]|nr:hypothetical protein [Euryarchaeota archaeon]
MSLFVVHPGLAPETVQARAYQLQAVDEAMSGSMLLVLPTAAGKTAVAWMTIVERLEKEGGWALVISPTVALSNQHLENTSSVISNIEKINPICLSGHNPSSKRKTLWGTSKLIFATPQVVRNDCVSGILTLRDCSLLVVDEAHHCTGGHAMADVVDSYSSQSEKPLILATTASPGSRKIQIEEVCRRLRVERIHLRTQDDPLLSDYLAELDIDEISVEVPVQIRDLAEPLRIWQEGIVARERMIGSYVMPGPISQAGLSNAMERAQSAIRDGNPSGYGSSSQIAIAMRLHHLINHLLCQGVAASCHFLKRMESEDSKSRSSTIFLQDLRIKKLFKQLVEMGEIHSKVGAVRRLVRERIRRDADSRVIVFANFRDTVDALEDALSGLDGIRAAQFIGQSSRSGSGGLTAKEQVSRLADFRDGRSNVLVATSVGEEGLDIPSADLVVFYEPVSSEIRTIQRRGRTGRKRAGEVVVLIAEGTRDEGAKESARRKEEFMHKILRRVSRELNGPRHGDLKNMGSFQVKTPEGVLSAYEYIIGERERARGELAKEDLTPKEAREKSGSSIPISNFRPSGQTGLEEF